MNKEINTLGATPDEATHYKGVIEPIEIMTSLLQNYELIGFLKGNIIKYSYRAGKKKGESEDKDAIKFKVYSEWLTEATTKGTITLSDTKVIKLNTFTP